MLGKYRFRGGQRVRLSQEGRDACLHRRSQWERRGTVTKVDKFNCPTVLWDDRLTPKGYHADFIEPLRKR